MSDYKIRPIGWVRSPLKERHEAPHQGRRAGVEAELIIEEVVLQGLEGIQTGDKLFVLCWLHMADRKTLRVHPKGNPAIPKRGVFATRSPDRPNPIGLCLVDVLAVEGPVLKVRGLDAVDGTPIVDLKPYICSLDT
ncbi:MAG: tRNA (N6-threonylcarbamoyladenosine(37)-N6)-methyltransferase TrmO [Deltaproteobacteria bacterium]|nr:tRNA (N6-threonylcarbamoyladenosine(37)-N6)-methyltransferase TrmO [Deltaproteobacteria bacterium]MBW2018975.1 tRNA (N6-threonylcarbamoyladenosine(37)-N6)-methyltransferase TrmO [Deltaproteobacteria bacterium]MBW2073565.1 tRNA (N6-threonylcarbamoyladenosine(37)-N6)-methyltransferase TrmO [Deltaproteobacteria bacterium]RLB82722.1 MAG: tRNA (N6-threonylcarbamoyladenosine(37)-N6)-methyltransferase TrmO [Deltaproteobacteria bacterium]